MVKLPDGVGLGLYVVVRFVAYIDEAGDEGFGKLGLIESTAQSRWFAIGAVVVRQDDDGHMPRWKTEILSHFPKKKSADLHFRELKHEQRVQTCRLLAQKPIGACVVLSNKITLVDHPRRDVFKQKQYLYNYLTRLLLERLTEACRRKARLQYGDAAHLQVVFSRRRGTDFHVMRRYLEHLKEGRELIAPVRSIDWSILDPSDILVENHSKRAGLQIADIVTSAFWHALEPNIYGFCEQRYAREVALKLIRAEGQRLGTGLTIIPSPEKCDLSSEQRDFVEFIRAC